MKLAKLKRFSNWMAKTKLKSGDKVIKLREDRSLMARCLVIAKERPGVIPKLEDLVGNYEVALVPRANFAMDGTLLLTPDKSSLMTGIREHPQIPDKPPCFKNEPEKPTVLLLDAMCEVKALQKKPGVNKMKDLKKQFIKKN